MDASQGTDKPESGGVQFIIPDETPTMTGYDFVYWTAVWTDTSSGSPIKPGQKILVGYSNTITLKANWQLHKAADTTPPTITTPGDETIQVGAQFDPMQGVTATDDVDGDLTTQVTVNGTVDVNTPGSYRLSYSVSDSAGNVGTAERTITVVSAGTTIACAPQTGDPAASVWQWTALFGAGMCLVLAGVAFRMRRMAGRTDV